MYSIDDLESDEDPDGDDISVGFLLRGYVINAAEVNEELALIDQSTLLDLGTLICDELVLNPDFKANASGIADVNEAIGLGLSRRDVEDLTYFAIDGICPEFTRNRPTEVHLGLADPTIPIFQTIKTLPTT